MGAAATGGGRRVSRMPRTLKITREGRYYLAFTLGVGFAATNTGNNLLFLILGMLLALIIVSGLLSEAALRRLTVERVLPAECRAGEPVLVGVRLRNENRRLPSIGLEIEEVDLEDAQATSGRCLRVLAGETGRAGVRVTPRRRGEIALVGLKVTTRYPFGIFAKSRRYDLPASLLAWPARVEAPPVPPTAGRDEVGPPVARRGGHEDLRGLRDYRDGDEMRHVHWRRSMRVGQMLVVERDAPEGRRIRLALPPGRGEPFEDAVRLMAARAEDHLARGDEVALEAFDGWSVPFGRGLGHRRRVLAALARVPPATPTPAAGAAA
jgi:uncharacterized protein (DUF58 family)